MSLRAVLAAVLLGALHGPSCGTDTLAGGVGAPCTRTSDCERGLTCVPPVCAAPDAGGPDGGTAADAGESDAAAAD